MDTGPMDTGPMDTGPMDTGPTSRQPRPNVWVGSPAGHHVSQPWLHRNDGIHDCARCAVAWEHSHRDRAATAPQPPILGEQAGTRPLWKAGSSSRWKANSFSCWQAGPCWQASSLSLWERAGVRA